MSFSRTFWFSFEKIRVRKANSSFSFLSSCANRVNRFDAKNYFFQNNLTNPVKINYKHREAFAECMWRHYSKRGKQISLNVAVNPMCAKTVFSHKAGRMMRYVSLERHLWIPYSNIAKDFDFTDRSQISAFDTPIQNEYSRPSQ